MSLHFSNFEFFAPVKLITFIFLLLHVNAAALTCRSKKIKVISLTGAKNSKLEKCSDICIKAPSEITSHIQELHITIIHLLCILIELEILEKAEECDLKKMII